MLLRKNTWCPLIKDYCKGALCVCHKQKVKAAVRGGDINLKARPFCTHFCEYLPEDGEAGEPDERV